MKNSKLEWNLKEISEIYHKPFLGLIQEAQTVHSRHFQLGEVQVSSLISVKTGGCSEDCAYCPQAARYQTDINKHSLMKVDEVMSFALKAKEHGASRVCLGAAWREVKDGKDFEQVKEMVSAVSRNGLEVCCTLGMLDEKQARELKEAGLHAYNHNIDTSEEYYGEIISTRDFSDRLKTLANVRQAGLSVCTGGILGLGESIEDRLKMLQTLANMDPHPDSVPINTLVAVQGTPLEGSPQVEIDELVRIIATARILMPKSLVRLSAGRLGRGIADHALCFLAGANSIFAGDKLLTTPNPCEDADEKMLQRLGVVKKKI